MKILKKFSVRLLLLLLSVVLVSCGSRGYVAETDTESAETILTKEDLLIIGENRSSSYRVIIAENSDEFTLTAANQLTKGLQQEGLIVMRDDDSSQAVTYEILLGNTNRSETLAPDGQLMLTVENNKILILADGTLYLTDAVELFLAQLKIIDGTVGIMKNLSVTQEIAEKTQKSTSFKVATFNVHWGGEDVGEDCTILAEDIKASGASLVALQEIYIGKTDYDPSNMAKQLSELTGLPYYYCAVNSHKYGYGVGLLSKYPLENCTSYELPKSTPDEQFRTVLCAELEVDGVDITCFVSHNEQVSIMKQLSYISDLAQKHHTYVVMADFNWDRYEDFHFCFKNASLALDYENRQPTTHSGYAFDNVVVPNRSAVINSCKVVDTTHSDHFMVIADVTFYSDWQ